MKKKWPQALIISPSDMSSSYGSGNQFLLFLLKSFWKTLAIHPCLWNKSKAAHVTSHLHLMTSFSVCKAISVHFISDLNKSLCGKQPRLIDWLLWSCCFGLIDSSISDICSIILSSGIHPKPCQQIQHSALLTVIGLPRWESLDLIRKGTWPSNYKLSSAPRWHLSTRVVLQFALALAPP